MKCLAEFIFLHNVPTSHWKYSIRPVSFFRRSLGGHFEIWLLGLNMKWWELLLYISWCQSLSQSIKLWFMCSAIRSLVITHAWEGTNKGIFSWCVAGEYFIIVMTWIFYFFSFYRIFGHGRGVLSVNELRVLVADSTNRECTLWFHVQFHSQLCYNDDLEWLLQ